MCEPNEFVVRPYEAGDHEQLVERVRELQASERRIEPRMKDPATLGAPYVERMLNDCRKHDGTIFIADRSGEVVGYASVFATMPNDDYDEVPYSYALLADLAVTPSLRGRGIGRRLIAACEAYARGRGAQWLRIFALAENEGAVRLYRSSGFAPRVIELEMSL